ncbi:glutathione S-transferase family protein [Pseudoalteromonas sp. McH1-7]|uniref:glutathione S-transferase family protein n=1 Tax=Pseudoalteromonas sp. McH1-7 TaxID=2745574 RepID=UPI0015916E9C|nr:glutathione S-transferase family protein [Pseudoalteromonas sp. McH1-7]NUZ11555.1 glutathione S-transferase family protein [Pseudoalteromonas sp. McH1-7]
MLTVHHLNASRSTRVIWLLNELGLTYDIVRHQRDPDTHLAPDSLKAIHPLGKAPVLVDNEHTLCESGAIIEYILDKSESNQMRPEHGTPAYYKYLEWTHFAEGSLALPVIASVVMKMEQRQGDQAMDSYINKEIDVDFSYIDATLAEQAFFAGEEFSAADIMMTVMLDIADNIGLISTRKNIKAYLSKIHDRAAYKAAQEQG